MLKLYKQRIRYVKDSGETSKRTIIPTFIPQQNIKAVDVSDLSDTDATQMESLLNEYYGDYLANRDKTTFSFDDWLHATGYYDMSTKVKWRTFKLDNVKEY